MERERTLTSGGSGSLWSLVEGAHDEPTRKVPKVPKAIQIEGGDINLVPIPFHSSCTPLIQPHPHVFAWNWALLCFDEAILS